MILAYELLARLDSGLTLAGYVEGEYEWVGDSSQWARVDYLEDVYSKGGRIVEDFADGSNCEMESIGSKVVYK